MSLQQLLIDHSMSLSQELIHMLELHRASRQGLDQVDDDTNEVNECFRCMTDGEVAEMLGLFAAMEVYQDIVPFWTDDQSNYIGIYGRGPLACRVCHISHEETDVAPAYRNVESLIAELEQHPEAEWEELSKDYPALTPAETAVEEADLAAVRELEHQLEVKQPDDDVRCQWINSILAVMPRANAAELLKYLNDEDMFVQEWTAELMGLYGLQEAEAPLQELSLSGIPNAAPAATRALVAIRKARYMKES
ncbi:SMI1/KNR4 family protein [Paenibacillus donghaensis]|uniref:HEAT repeat domain-containing protein n=1 Tax=Paenibacillus donghaensis TaxID=414771 RepID=A0A2Z2K7T7_9BACL|nr:SMI1/KNR4 family protein [Paenibacillus donghaensis]ASA21187.1 hypothetical protein B9T62_10540 [Paenibacillus donghaensis]